MDNNIKFLFNIKDEHLCFDEKIPFEEYDGCKIVHLIQTYAVCGKRMLKNEFKEVKIKAFPINKTSTILAIKKQKYICKPSDNCPKQVTKIASIKGIQPKHQIADTINESIAIDLTKNRSIKDIAQDNNVSSNTVLRKLRSLSSFFNVNRH